MPDGYGVYQATKEDFKEIAIHLEGSETVVFPYSNNQTDCYILIFSKNFTKLGIMPFGGNPEGRVYVGLYGKGCHHFNLKEDAFPGYISEKLGIGSHGSEALSELFKGVGEYL